MCVSGQRYESYKAASTVSEYLKLGGLKADVKFDYRRSYLGVVREDGSVQWADSENTATTTTTEKNDTAVVDTAVVSDKCNASSSNTNTSAVPTTTATDSVPTVVGASPTATSVPSTATTTTSTSTATQRPVAPIMNPVANALPTNLIQSNTSTIMKQPTTQPLTSSTVAIRPSSSLPSQTIPPPTAGHQAAARLLPQYLPPFTATRMPVTQRTSPLLFNQTSTMVHPLQRLPNSTGSSLISQTIIHLPLPTQQMPFK